MENIVSFFTENFWLITIASIALYTLVSFLVNKKGAKKNGTNDRSDDRNNDSSTDGK